MKNTSKYDTELSLAGERGTTKSATTETLKSGGPYGRIQKEWTRRQDHFCGSRFSPGKLARHGEDRGPGTL
jgi:hypothetical protein